MAEVTEQASRHQVWRMFDRIAPRYDLLNRLLSGRRDVAWRRRMATYLNDSPNQTVVDVATGTADVLLTLVDVSPKVSRGVGVDMSNQMLAIGREKIARAGLTERLVLIEGDALALPVESRSYDSATIAFGIRNVENVQGALGEMRRVLKPGGRCIVLEFSIPSSPTLRGFYLFYLRNILPRIGNLISGDSAAYTYLNKTIETFPHGEGFCAEMRRAGFSDVTAQPQTFGIASIYAGTA
jgi:demethylmenaquinone methyltransferase / 2-methoxy-6-polyprenyl-1,4-benzoquinol methylase